MKNEPTQPDDREAQEPSPYLRRARHVEVRRGAERWRKILILGSVSAVLAAALAGAAGWTVYAWLAASPRFALREPLVVVGAERAPREQAVRIFAADFGRSVFQTPLELRRQQIEALVWVKTARVARAWPNRIRVVLEERQPVAFVRLGDSGRPWLVDADGTLLPQPRQGRFSLPALTGLTQTQSAAERQFRVGVMLELLEDLDRQTPKRSGEVDEIDLTDPADAVVIVSPGDRAVTLHLGGAHFLDRYKFFLANVEAWRRQYGSVRSVDLRYETHIVVQP